MAKQNLAKLAFRFVLIIGIVNFFADMTYEGARSIVGPFLGIVSWDTRMLSSSGSQKSRIAPFLVIGRAISLAAPGTVT
jgi:hypothetical protein